MKMIIIKPIWIVLMFNCISSVICSDDRNIQPTRYLLQFWVNPEEDDFYGCTHIFLKVDPEKNSTVISLHMSWEINVTTITLNDSKNCSFSRVNLDAVQLYCDEPAKTGDFILICYNTKYSSYMMGLYKSNYMEEGRKKIFLATQFESVYARTVFPCFDKPIYKARFSIEIVCPKEYNALSNTRIDSISESETNNSYVKYKFAETPAMSTYLVAFVISQFESTLEYEMEHPYKYQIYARPSAKDFMGTAVKYGTKLIDTMSSWIKIDYEALGNIQINQVALPNLYPGAMENWGLITYREEELMDQRKITSASRQQCIISIMAHEISHQWFGNYVTTKSWTHIWLNEGFACYFQYHIPSKVLNYDGEDLEMEKQFVGEQLNLAFVMDEQLTSHPLSYIKVDMDDPSQIENMFDIISYAKGASIIRMMSYVLGMEVFRQGLTSYLEDRKYRCATPEMLLNHLENATGNKIEAFTEKMKTWIYESGFPVVTARLDKNTYEIIITQKNINSESEIEWYIPITYTTSSEKRFTFDDFIWLEPNTTLKIPFKNESWIIFNLQVTGYYRVNYDTELLDNIITALKGEDRNKIDSLNKAQLINDVFNNAKLGQIHYKKFFDLVDYLQHETDYYPWYAALQIFDFMLDKINYESQLLLKNWILKQIQYAFGETPYFSAGNKHISSLRNEMLQLWKCKLGQKKCLEYAKSTFANFKIDRSLRHDERYLVFCYAIKYSHNSTEDYNFLITVLKASTFFIERDPILKSLGCFLDPDILSKCLQETISSDSPMRKEDMETVFISLSSSGQVGIDTILGFLETNYRATVQVMRYRVQHVLRSLAKNVITPGQREKFRRIISKYGDSSDRWFIHIMDKNEEWISIYGDEIKSILKQGQNEAPGFVLQK